MPKEVINNIPAFEGDTPPEDAQGKEVKEATTDEVVEEEKETPPESSTEKKPAEGVQNEETQEDKVGEDGADAELQKQVQGLQGEKEKLLKEIQDLRGTRREIKQAEIKKVDEQIDELKDLHPEDIQFIERILKAKGYVSKDDVKKQLYEEVKQQELDKFLAKYPEYKPENDSQDINWNSLQRELAWLRMPEDPHRVGDVLERARKAMSSGSAIERQNQPELKQRMKTAGVGAGGEQRSSSLKSFSPEKREQYSRGGFTDEEIKEMENSL